MGTVDSFDSDIAHAREIIELIAQETRSPVEEVSTLYASQTAVLESSARIKTFISVLAARQVRQLLRQHVRAAP